MESKVTQPKWHEPAAKQRGTLKIYNSLTRSKDAFNPISANRVTWYSCGPTVYDASHMGHARNYVSTDINRRIIQDYFGYNIMFVQNVTDIDDKIIVSARHEYLFKKYVAGLGGKITPDVVATAKDATIEYSKNNVEGPGSLEEFIAWEKVLPEEKKGAKFKMHKTAIETAFAAIKDVDKIGAEEFLASIKPVLVPVLDKKEGHTVTDHKVFRDLSSYWEHDYDNDMAALNVLPPSIVTRVSEYVPEIITFVERIIENGFAYTTEDGSVYFDTYAFEKNGHDYAKLQPWNKGKQDLIDEGEGSLSASRGGKKSSNDFALWKASKPGEPAWKWTGTEGPKEGRPGWHIECSVMASEIIGDRIDIHTGGIDLAFPHHDNELAQSEAGHQCNQWINYFMHAGHLHIEGSKMSKSLKNFISIKKALELYSARQLRLAFALQQWNNQMDFRTDIPEVRAYESTLNNYFNNLRAIHREQIKLLSSGHDIPKKAGKDELELYNSLYKTQDDVHEAFCDNLSTPSALSAIGKLVQTANSYLASHTDSYRAEPLLEIARYITKILGILGFRVNSDYGWAADSATDNSGTTADIAAPFVDVLSIFRDNVRNGAIAKAPNSEFLEATDKVRSALLDLGVSLDDRGAGQSALVKFLDPQQKEQLIKERDEKVLRESQKAAKKAAAAKQAEEERLKRIEKAKIEPSELFKSRSEFADFDEKGFPVKTKDGEELSKSAKKKLEKELQLHTALHLKYKEGKL